jgi:trk system potassium uptake protein TrkH
MNPIARWIRAETEERFFRLLDRLLFFAGLLSAAVLIRELGWGGTTGGKYWPWSLLVAKGILIFFVTQGLLRLTVLARPWVYAWRRKGHYLMLLLATAALAGSNAATAFLHAQVPPDQLRVALLGFLALSQLPLLGMTLIDFIRRSSSLGFRFFNAGQIFVLTYLLTATLGALLLKTPNATRDPESFTWMQAAFTSTSAVCITGLTVVDVERVFTPVGQFIIMLLIQIGGLGIMSLTYLLGLLAGGGGASLRNRYAMQSLLDERSLAEVSTALIQIAAFMVAIEAAGAFFLFHFHQGIAHLPWNERAFSAAFHAVSAFCNAGFSIHSEGMAHPALAGNDAYLAVIMILVTLGGLGFPVLRNLWAWGRARWSGRTPDESSRLLVHTKVVLIASACLTFGGGLFFWIEHAGPENERLLHGLFLSAAARTAGFNTYDLATLNTYAIAGLAVLMFIGGSPGSTAGGVRTTTITILLLDVWRVLRGRESQIVFGRKISRQVRDRALATVILSLAVLATAAALMRWLEPGLPAEAVLFECVSAFATTGLSLNLTPRLSEAGQAVIIALMLTGRIGILLLATSLLQRPDATRIDHPRGILQI